MLFTNGGMRNMTKYISRVAVCLVILLTLFTSIVSARSLEEKRAELEHKVETTLEKFYELHPEARAAVEGNAGYAVFTGTSSQFGVFGSSHVRGMAINNYTGEKVYMKGGEAQVGLGIGIKEYSLVFVFCNEEAWEKFISKKWSVGGSANIDANDGVTGGGLDGASRVDSDIYVYQFTTKGLAAQVGITGTYYTKDDDYYPKKKKQK